MQDNAKIEGTEITTDKVGLPAIWLKADIKKDQDGIKRSLTKLEAAIHANAIQCMMHAEEHGDTSLMRRLLIDIVDPKSGYRTQGLIAWMRHYSPMELKGDVIKLTGTLPNGDKRPWRIAEANANPFAKADEFREMALKPIYRETLTNKIMAAVREGRQAMANTVNGKPVDAKKGFFDGIHQDKVNAFLEDVEGKLVELDAFRDSTRDVRTAQQKLKEAELEMADASKAAG